MTSFTIPKQLTLGKEGSGGRADGFSEATLLLTAVYMNSYNSLIWTIRPSLPLFRALLFLRRGVAHL